MVKPRTLGREVPGSCPPVAVRCGLELNWSPVITHQQCDNRQRRVSRLTGTDQNGPERTETDWNGPKRTFVDTETDFLGTETDFNGYRNGPRRTGTDRNGPERTETDFRGYRNGLSGYRNGL